MIECDISAVAFGGDAIAKVDGLVIFAPFALPEERVKLRIIQKKTHFARALVQEILTPSSHRISPPCPYFTICGGCQFQHSDYPLQLGMKRRFVEDAFFRIGKIHYSISPVIPSKELFAYRRHITLQLESFHDKWHIGFASQNGSFLPIQSCLLFHLPQETLLSEIQNSINLMQLSPHSSGRLKIVKKNSKHILAFSFANPLSTPDISLLSSLSELSSVQGVIVQTPTQEHICKDTVLTYMYDDLLFTYSPFSFIQNHEKQSERIYSYIVDLLQNGKKILDLYCGIGITTLLLAKRQKEVVGIEVSPIAIHCATTNAKNNHLSHVPFFCAPAEESLSYFSSFAPDTVLVNPPKTGLSPIVQKILSHPCIRQIAYISCHPPTLARDCKALVSYGFTLSHLQSFDMFPQTTHVETVVLLSR